jgi:hypothetical protein
MNHAMYVMMFGRDLNGLSYLIIMLVSQYIMGSTR